MLEFRRSMGRAERGSTEPLLVVDADGVTWLVKLAPAPMLDHVAELVSAHLARAAAIDIPEARVGRVGPALRAAMARGPAHERRFASAVAALGPDVFASRWLDAEDVTAPPDDDAFLARLYAFDLLIHNGDRLPHHPNLLRVAGRLTAMDHAQGLPWCRDQAAAPADELPPVGRARGLAPAPLPIREQDLLDAVAAIPAGWLSALRRESLAEGLAERLAWLQQRWG